VIVYLLSISYFASVIGESNAIFFIYFMLLLFIYVDFGYIYVFMANCYILMVRSKMQLGISIFPNILSRIQNFFSLITSVMGSLES